MTTAEIKRIKSLSQKKYRDEHHLFVVEGEKLVAEALHSSFAVQKIVTTKPFDFPAPNHLVEQVGPATMERISSFKTAPPVLAVVEKPATRPLPALAADELYLALDDIQDPGNLGTIVRLADWFGIRHIFCSHNTVECYNPKALQATMGAIFRVGVHYTALPAFLQQAKATTPVYGTALAGENIYTQPLSKGGIVVMGNEGNGLSAEVDKTITERLFIPPYPAAANSSESLNVAVSTAIVCAEFRRRTAMPLP